MKWIHILCAGALLGAVACGEEEPAETEQAAEEAAAALEGALNMAADQAAEAADEAAAETDMAAGEAENAAEATAMGFAALGQALAAGTMQAEGGTPCEQAYNGMRAMVEALQKAAPGGMSSGMMPEQSEFMSACNQLPEEAQQCMVMSYAVQHQAECQEVMQSPEVQRVRQMMRGGN